ncbi:MAG: DNA mismatch repair endonuclease MutL [Kiritimatiellae bacterium]|nr:DNA mismatch repair endonuclease MutL [Kiritimatiellia bacterium]
MSAPPSSPAIRLLPDAVINQIAAGEVVERPASVLKELVENSLDAGARHIDVEADGGGARMLRIRDDGCGMDRDNALLSLERHATSKLRALSDLDTIATMGFRGEALAAISAVSQFTMVTQRAGDPAGTEIQVNGGSIADVRDAGAPPGTEITVRNLFYNVPARRKFLRSAATEFTHIRHAFTLEALAHPDVEFTLTADGETLHRLPAAPTLLDRVRDLYGRELASHLREVRHASGAVSIGGLAGLPPFSRMDREWQVVMINGRPSGSPVINYAIQTAYRETLPGGRYAPLFLQIALPADQVDVNVHPAKKEVRFRHPTEVRDIIVEALRLAIGGSPREPARPIGEWRRRDEKPAYPAPFPPPPPPTPVPVPPGPAPSAPLPPPPTFSIQTGLDLPPAPPPAPSPSPAPPVPVPQGAPPSAPTPTPSPVPPPSTPWSTFHILGRTGPYAVLSTPDGLVILDPRSAHERILYERMLAAATAGAVPSQGLLPPVPVTLSPTQHNTLLRHLPTLRDMGFGLSEFGSGTLLLDALPADLPPSAPPAELLSDLADALAQSGRTAARDWARPLIAERASRLAVAREQPLTDLELETLVRDLSRTEMPYTSPRGKPTVILTPLRELHRKFGRE